MTYAKRQDLVDRFGQQELLELTDKANQGSINDTAVTRALTDADANINGAIAGRYVLPLPSTPVMLVRIACDIARYYLYDDKATEQVTKRYNDATAQLNAIGAGTLSMGLDAGGVEDQPAGSAAITANGRVFSAGNLSDY